MQKPCIPDRYKLRVERAEVRCIVMASFIGAIFLPDNWAVKISLAGNLLWLWEL